MPTCPPLQFDEALVQMLERYRAAKKSSAAASKQGAQVERQGHYDKDTPLATRTAIEGDASTAERSAAVALADELLRWYDRHQ